MEILVDVLVIVAALAFAALGAWRGFRRAIYVTLAGIVLGVLMGGIWGNEEWISTLASRWGGVESAWQGTIGLISLFWILIFVGYGTSLFLPRPKLKLWQRLAGGAVGLFNGLLLVTFSYQYIQWYFLENKADSALKTSRISSVLIEWLPWIFLGIIVVITLAVTVYALMRLARYVGRLAQASAEAAPASPPAALVPELSPTAAPSGLASPVEEVSKPEEPTIPCPNCGEPVSFGAAYCPHCGKIVS